ncbi:hypothetical protein ACIBBG_31750 [Micromonospora chersina]|uniref:hypothetical protein n=1 Tax=Micromonospora chersina TaxID=47854 RepID=UPI0037944F40
MHQARTLGHHVHRRREHRRDRPTQHRLLPGTPPRTGWHHLQAPPLRPPVKVDLDGKTKNKRVDIAVFAPGADHTEANLRRVVVCKQEPKHGKNVVKLRDLDQMKTEQAELEALLGAEDFPERRWGMWTDNVDFFFIEKESGRFGAPYHQRAD